MSEFDVLLTKNFLQLGFMVAFGALLRPLLKLLQLGDGTVWRAASVISAAPPVLFALTSLGLLWLAEGDGFRVVALHGAQPKLIALLGRKPVIHPSPQAPLPRTSDAVSPAGKLGGPFISSLSPDHGPAAGGTTVVITGRNFTGATAMRFGANNAAFTVDSDTQITAVSPPV